MNRRSLLKISGVAVGVALAGCTGVSELPGDDETATPTPTQTATPPTQSPTEKEDITIDLDSIDLDNDEEELGSLEIAEDSPDLSHLHSITGQTYPPEIDGYYHRRYEWSSGGQDWWYETSIPRNIGEYYKNRFGQSGDYPMYVNDPYGQVVIGNLANNFGKMASRYNLSERETVNMAMNFVQELKYTKDAYRTGFDHYIYYPVETLIERGGDCEDVAILLAAILREMGYECVLLGLWETEPEAHMALGVLGDSSVSGSYYQHNGKRYYYVEATGRREVGEMPDWGGSTDAEIIEIKDSPTFVYAYETSASRESVKVSARLWNYGQESPYLSYFKAQFEDKYGGIFDEKVERITPIEYGESVDISMELRPPDDTTLRLNTYVIVEGEIHDLDQSEWRRPV